MPARKEAPFASIRRFIENRSGYLLLLSFAAFVLVRLLQPLLQPLGLGVGEDYSNALFLIFLTFLTTVLFELWQRTVKAEIAAKYYPSMVSAQEDIIDSIGAVSRRNGGNPTDIRIIGCRFTHISTVLNNLAQRLRSNDLHCGPIRFHIYYTDPDYLRLILPSPATVSSADVHQRIKDLKASLTQASQLVQEVRCVPYSNPPFLYVYIIGEDRIFWGTFRPDPAEPVKYYVGPPNPCSLIRRGDGQFETFSRWLIGICADYDRLAAASDDSTEARGEELRAL